MRHFLVAAATVLLAGAVSCGQKPLPRAHADADATRQMDSVFIEVAANATNELHSMMVAQHGKVIYERWGTGHTPQELHVCWSASKTFTATAVGFAVQDGLLNVDDPLVKFFPEYVPEDASDTLKALTVKHLLTMSSGLAKDEIKEINANLDKEPTKNAFRQHFLFWPGEKYRYNSWNTYLLSAIVTKLTGKRVSEYLEEKLFRHIGIRDYVWEQSEEGVDFGGWGLFTTTENLTRMGLWMLNRGNWNGRQLLNQAWFDEAMSPQVLQYQNRFPDIDAHQLKEKYKEDDWNQGYGYQMWCCTHGAYRLDGAHCQWVIIIPEKDAVITVTSHVSHSIKRQYMGYLWKHVYPLL